MKPETVLTLLLLLPQLSFRLLAATPAFPTPYDATLLDHRRIHILAESISDNYGYQTIEEFVDFSLGKGTYIVTDEHSGGSHIVTHVDVEAESGVVFRYKPYSCRSLKASDPEITEQNTELWHKVVSFTSRRENSNADKTGQFHLYGIVALWLRATELEKSYEVKNLIYSASKDVSRSADCYILQDPTSNQTVYFYFTRSKTSKGMEMQLDMIQILDRSTSFVIKTVNILTLEHSIQDEVYENILQRPVGYGCISSFSDAASARDYPNLSDNHIGVMLSNSHKVELEATATKFVSRRQPEAASSADMVAAPDADEQKTSSDTISVELIRTAFVDALGLNHIQSIRLRDSFRDSKTILNYQYHVQYELDLRRGLCKMSNMGTGFSKDETVGINFSNGLKLSMNSDSMRELFVETEGFHYIKRLAKGPFRDFVYFERELTVGSGVGEKTGRVVRVYSMASSRSRLTMEPNGEQNIKLESVTIYVFDNKQEQLIESYNLNVLEAEELTSELELAKLFDISDECYLDNDDMRDGRDYAWFELTYPIASHHRELMAGRAQTLTEQLYSLIVHAYLGLFRAPKMELMFTETGLIVRALLLDLPPLELMFDSRENAMLRGDKSAPEGRDFEELASDLKHCTELCKFYKCKTMSFCENTHICALSTEQVPLEVQANNQQAAGTGRRLVESRGCRAFVLPNDETILYENVFDLSLHRQLSKLQHQDYRDIELPKMPDELMLPPSETNLDEASLDKMAKEYIIKLSGFLNEHEAEGLPSQIYVVNMDGVHVVLAPNKFELERDPLSEFDLSDKSLSLTENQEALAGGSGGGVPSFHQGLSVHHFKINLLLERDESAKKTARLFSGINYDQCALACVDSRCSSFSYCNQRQECIITDIYDIGTSLTKSLLEQDIDCFIAQRDFLSKFNKFPEVVRPNVYKKSVEVYNPSECAHACIVETGFNCLAFDYCHADSAPGNNAKGDCLATCYYLDTNQIAEDLAAIKIRSNATESRDLARGSCTHYSRSYLADFSRIPNRKLPEEQLAKLKTSAIQGRSVDQCADVCVNELADCTAFQFCFDPLAEGAMQSCVMIESKPLEEESKNFDVVLGDNSTLNQEVLSSGKFIIDSPDCHLFSLRRDSTEAHFRDLALNSMTTDELRQKEGQEPLPAGPGGLTIGRGILLYLCLTLASAGLGCALCLAKHRSQLVREKIERVQLLLGL